MTRTLLLVAAVFAVSACGGDQQAGAESGAVPVGSAQQEPVSMDLRQQIEFAHADLAVRLGIGKDGLQLTEAEQVHWPDSSMGCPLPDRGYTQVITPGVLIRFTHGKTVYEYHGGRSGQPFLCEPPATIQRPAAVNPPARGFDDGT